MRRTLISIIVVVFLPTVYSCSPSPTWVARYDGPEHGSDWARAMTVDSTGCVYVTGRSEGDGHSDDYATVKYDLEGHEVWTARYNGPDNDDDSANAIAVDDSGNVYVTGRSCGTDTLGDFATIKYDPEGHEVWTARFNGPGDDWDVAEDLVVGGDDTVTVTGRSSGFRGNSDCLTIRYSLEGDELWIARYDGPGEDWDQADSMAVDNLGNVYVTGYSVGIGTSSDYVTIKYNSDGDESWVARYDGDGVPYNHDSARAVAVDDSGNVYVTGTSQGVETDDDYATIKYDPAGRELWVARYDGPAHWEDSGRAIALDKNGNVHVAGISEWDYTTIQYDKDGNRRWLTRYDGPAGNMDVPTGLVVDDSGSVYVTGFATVFIFAGDIPVFDYATIKYDSNGRRQWLARYNGPSLWNDAASSMALDAAGNVYVTGNSNGVGTGKDYATIKYAQGAELAPG